MFINDLNKVKEKIKKRNQNRKRFFILKNDYILILIILLIIESKAQSLINLQENTNEIFIIINKTLKREIINNTYNNKISEVLINGIRKGISEVDNTIINSKKY